MCTAREFDSEADKKSQANMPDRHQIRNALRNFVRAAQRDAKSQRWQYVNDLAPTIAATLVATTDPIYGRVNDRVKAMLESSVLFNRDEFCGEKRAMARLDAKV